MLMTLEIPALEPPATATRKPAAVELVDVSKSFGGHHIHAVSNVSLAVNAGEIVSILGPSGCGKTTTMRMIAGLEDPTSGYISRRRAQRPGRTRRTDAMWGWCFQSLAIFPYSVRPAERGFRPSRMRERRGMRSSPGSIARSISSSSPGTFADRRPSQMSGGQLQRRPGPDHRDGAGPRAVRRAHGGAGPPASRPHGRRTPGHPEGLDIAAIYVTHDQETASMMSDRIVIMEAGRVVQSGTPADIYQRPANRFVAEFLGDLNSLAGISGGHAGEGAPSPVSASRKDA